MASEYRYTLERQDNGWWLVRFPMVPEEARSNACDCLVAALEGYEKAAKPLPLGSSSDGVRLFFIGNNDPDHPP
jgi:hypothetical protein